jgi:hypothetical protein
MLDKLVENAADFATDGTPLELRKYSIYGPGGAIFPFAGAVMVNEPVDGVNVSGMNR